MVIRMYSDAKPLLLYTQHAAMQIMPLLPAATARMGYEMSAVSLLGLATSLVRMTPTLHGCLLHDQHVADCIDNAWLAMILPKCALTLHSRRRQTAQQLRSTPWLRLQPLQTTDVGACIHLCLTSC